MIIFSRANLSLKNLLPSLVFLMVCQKGLANTNNNEHLEQTEVSIEDRIHNDSSEGICPYSQMYTEEAAIHAAVNNTEPNFEPLMNLIDKKLSAWLDEKFENDPIDGEQIFKLYLSFQKLFSQISMISKDAATGALIESGLDTGTIWDTAFSSDFWAVNRLTNDAVYHTSIDYWHHLEPINGIITAPVEILGNQL